MINNYVCWNFLKVLKVQTELRKTIILDKTQELFTRKHLANLSNL